MKNKENVDKMLVQKHLLLYSLKENRNTVITQLIYIFKNMLASGQGMETKLNIFLNIFPKPPKTAVGKYPTNYFS